MSFTGGNARRHRSRLSELLLLSLVLSASFVCIQFVARVLSASAGGSVAQVIRDIAITVPVAAVAAWAGLRLASRMDLGRAGPGAALNKAAVISLFFTVLM